MLQIRSLHREKINQERALRQFLLDNKLTRSLARRVKICVQKSLVTRKLYENESHFLARLPNDLRAEVHAQIRIPILTVNRFMLDFYRSFPRAMVKLCYKACDTLSLIVGDRCFYAGDTALHMYFVVRGCMEYIHLMSLTQGLQSIFESIRQEEVSHI